MWQRTSHITTEQVLLKWQRHFSLHPLIYGFCVCIVHCSGMPVMPMPLPSLFHHCSTKPLQLHSLQTILIEGISCLWGETTINHHHLLPATRSMSAPSLPPEHKLVPISGWLWFTDWQTTGIICDPVGRVEKLLCRKHSCTTDQNYEKFLVRFYSFEWLSIQVLKWNFSKAVKIPVKAKCLLKLSKKMATWRNYRDPGMKCFVLVRM